MQSLVALAERGGLGQLLDEADLSASDLSARRRVDWEVYAQLVERFVARAGGIDEATHMADDLHLGAGVLDWVLSSRFAPRHLYAQVCSLAPRAWRNLEATVTPDAGALRVQARLVAGVGSAAFFHISRSSLATLPARAGLGRAEVEIEELSPMGATWRVSLPPNPNAEPDRRPAPDAQDRAAAASEAWRLTPTETLVLVEVLRGASNKEVAIELGMAEATVEIHMTHLFRKSGVHGRTSLISRVWSTAW